MQNCSRVAMWETMLSGIEARPRGTAACIKGDRETDGSKNVKKFCAKHTPEPITARFHSTPCLLAAEMAQEDIFKNKQKKKKREKQIKCSEINEN